MKKYFVLFSTLFIASLIFGPTAIVSASNSYNYTPLEEVIESAASMRLSRVVDNSNLVDADGNPTDLKFGTPRDVFVYEDRVYVSDAGNNLILVFNDDYALIDTYPSRGEDVPEEHLLNSPNGIYIRDGLLYIADTNNERVVVFNLETKEI